MEAMKIHIKAYEKKYAKDDSLSRGLSSTINKISSRAVLGQAVGMQCIPLDDDGNVQEYVTEKLQASIDTFNAAISACGSPDITDATEKAALHQCLDKAAITFINTIGQVSNNKNDYTSIEEFMSAAGAPA